MKNSRRNPVENDGYGVMMHCARGQMPFKTGYHPEGYYWQHVNGVPVGSYATRDEAAVAESVR